MSESGNDRSAASAAQTTAGTTPADASTGELVERAARQVSELIRAEMHMAVAELADKGRHAGRGAGLFGGAGVVAWYGGAALVGAAAAGLAVVVPVWAAALIVGAVLLAVAGTLALVGRKQLSQAVPPVPEQATESVKADMHAIKDHISERHRNA